MRPGPLIAGKLQGRCRTQQAGAGRWAVLTSGDNGEAGSERLLAKAKNSKQEAEKKKQKKPTSVGSRCRRGN